MLRKRRSIRRVFVSIGFQTAEFSSRDLNQPLVVASSRCVIIERHRRESGLQSDRVFLLALSVGADGFVSNLDRHCKADVLEPVRWVIFSKYTCLDGYLVGCCASPNPRKFSMVPEYITVFPVGSDKMAGAHPHFWPKPPIFSLAPSAHATQFLHWRCIVV